MLNQSGENGKPNPPSYKIEECLCGSMLRDPEIIVDVCRVIEAEDFESIWRFLFESIVRLYDQGKDVFLDMVFVDLAESGHEQDVSAKKLAECYESVFTGVNWQHYAEKIKSRSDRRKVSITIFELKEMLQDRSLDAATLVQSCEEKLFGLADVRDKKGVCGVGDAIREMEYYYDMINRLGSNVIKSGFVDLDNLISGFFPGELTVIAARPSVGKTALALGIAGHVLDEGRPVLFSSLEQSRLEIAIRLVCSRAKIDSTAFRKGKLSTAELSRAVDARAALGDQLLLIEDSPWQTISKIASTTRRHRIKDKIKLLIVDYLQLIESENFGIRRHEQIGQISSGLKGIAREVEIPVIALAQLNREVETRNDRKPRMSDLRESGSIEADADNIILMWREPDNPDAVHLLVEKCRNGPTGMVTLAFLRQFTKFENYAYGGIFP